MKGAGVETPILVAISMLLLVVLGLWTVIVAVMMPIEMWSYVKGFSVKRALATASYLLIHKVSGPGHVEGGSDAHGGPIQVSRADLGDVAATIYFFILLTMLIVVIGFECEFGPAHSTLEAPAMKECKVLEGPHSVHLVNRLITPETGALVKVHSIHGGA